MVPINRTNEQTSERVAKMTVAKQLLCIPQVAFSFRARIQIFSQEPAEPLCGGAWRLAQFFTPNLHSSQKSPPLPSFELGAALQPAAAERPGKKTRYRPTPKLKGGDILVAALVSCAEH